MQRTILHCDLNNFFASVECMLHPDLLLGKKFAVAGNPDDAHGIVLAKNTAARRYGVRTAETVWEARKKCPDLIFVPPSHDSYACFSKLVYQIYRAHTDKVQNFGLDECWLDVTQTVPMREAKSFADHLRGEIIKKTGLTISVGASFTKPFSKLGSDMKKPNATTVITPSDLGQKIHPLNVQNLLYVGPKTASSLAQLNIRTIGDLALADTDLLMRRLGTNGPKLQKMALGCDGDPVTGEDEPDPVKSVGHGTTVKRHVKTYAEAKQMIFMLSEMVAARLRRYGMKAGLVHLSCQNDLLATWGKQAALPFFTSAGIEIARKACEILQKIWNPHRQNPLRMMTVTAGNLTDFAYDSQISMFDGRVERQEKLENAIDGAKARFGRDVIGRAVLLGSVFSDDAYADSRSADDDYLPFRR